MPQPCSHWSFQMHSIAWPLGLSSAEDSHARGSQRDPRRDVRVTGCGGSNSSATAAICLWTAEQGYICWGWCVLYRFEPLCRNGESSAAGSATSMASRVGAPWLLWHAKEGPAAQLAFGCWQSFQNRTPWEYFMIAIRGWCFQTFCQKESRAGRLLAWTVCKICPQFRPSL
jgi:hypothetical protein